MGLHLFYSKEIRLMQRCNQKELEGRYVWVSVLLDIKNVIMNDKTAKMLKKHSRNSERNSNYSLSTTDISTIKRVRKPQSISLSVFKDVDNPDYKYLKF